MNVVSTAQSYMVTERFEKALRSIRTALHDVDLDIVGEFDLPETRHVGASRKTGSFKILLVSCPILDFEAVALGRAAAVFFPLHLMVTSEGERTRVSVVNPAGLFDARLPVGAVTPMNRLVARVELALESLLEGAENTLN
jgi:hypothetical protein